jgi:hypothetical protein
MKHRKSQKSVDFSNLSTSFTSDDSTLEKAAVMQRICEVIHLNMTEFMCFVLIFLN